MATQLETQGQLQEFLGILKRRKWQVLLPASIVIALGIALAVIVPKKYVARTQVELRPVGVSISAKEAQAASFQIRSSNRIWRVLLDRQHAEFLSLPPDEQNDFVDRVKSNVKVTPASGSATGAATGTWFVNIEYMDVNRDWALEFLRALSKDWIEDVLDRDRRKAAEDEEAKLLDERKKLENEEKFEANQISELKRKNAISPLPSVPGSGLARSEDPVSDRLARDQLQLATVEREILTLQARLGQLEAQYQAMPAKMSRVSLIEGKTSEAEVLAIENELISLRAQLKNLKPANSRHNKISSKIEALEEEREQLKAIVTRASLEETTIDNVERKPLELQIDALKVDIAGKTAEVADLKKDIYDLTARRDELHEVYLQIDAHEARIGRVRSALVAANDQYHRQVAQVLLLSTPQANPFQITEDVHAQTKPTEPNPWLIVGFALVLGLALGLAIALIAEYSKNCYRSVADISRVMVVPVLGAIGTILTRRERKLTTLRRTLVGVSSVVFVVAILFVTWAWAGHSQLLSQDLREAIDNLRSKMR